MILQRNAREVMRESQNVVVTVDCWLIYSSHIRSRIHPPSCSSYISRAEIAVKESPDDSDNNNRNYNDNDSDKNNYNVEIIFVIVGRLSLSLVYYYSHYTVVG